VCVSGGVRQVEGRHITDIAATLDLTITIPTHPQRVSLTLKGHRRSLQLKHTLRNSLSLSLSPSLSRGVTKHKRPQRCCVAFGEGYDLRREGA